MKEQREDSLKRDIVIRNKAFELKGDTWPCSEDLLERHSEIENISPVLLNARAPLVFGVDAPWGGGKTTFLNLWQHYLKCDAKVSLYLNAWENDFAEDPLLPMLSVLDSWLDKTQNKPAKSAWNKAKSYAPGIIKSTAVAAAKAATLGILDLEKEYEKLAADLVGDSVESLVGSFSVKQKSLVAFKEHLQKALEALPVEQPNLIVFVDELDRCRPTYAIEVLERIKHLFDVDRIVFVIAINRDQLSKSFQGVYGPAFDGDNYLKRFIDLDYHLKTAKLERYVKSKFYDSSITEYFTNRGFEQQDYSYASDILYFLAQRFSLTLRDVDQFAIRLELILRSIPKDHYIDVHLLVPMMILRQENLTLYRQYAEDASHANKVASFLLGAPIGQLKLDHSMAIAIGYLISAARIQHNASSVDHLIKPWRDWLAQMDTEDDQRSCVKTVIEFSSSSKEFMRRSKINDLAFKRIELLHKIDIS